MHAARALCICFSDYDHVQSVPEGNDAPMGVEIAADFWEVVGR